MIEEKFMSYLRTLSKEQASWIVGWLQAYYKIGEEDDN